MRKIPTLFQRNVDDHLVRDEVTPGCEWVLAGEGIATRKWDGTACLVRAGKFYKRYDAKHGKPPPPDFEPAQEQPDPETGHWPGWVPVGDRPEDRWLGEAFSPDLPDGTYECCGPKIQGNPEGFPRHVLLRHGAESLLVLDRSFAGFRDYLRSYPFEGIVFHHPDGRMAKIKARDFGFRAYIARDLRTR